MDNKTVTILRLEDKIAELEDREEEDTLLEQMKEILLGCVAFSFNVRGRSSPWYVEKVRGHPRPLWTIRTDLPISSSVPYSYLNKYLNTQPTPAELTALDMVRCVMSFRVP